MSNEKKVLNVLSVEPKRGGKGYDVNTNQGKFAAWDDTIKGVVGRTIEAEVYPKDYMGKTYWNIKSFAINDGAKSETTSVQSQSRGSEDNVVKLYSMLLAYAKDAENARVAKNEAFVDRAEHSSNIMLTFAEFAVAMRTIIAEDAESVMTWVNNLKNTVEPPAEQNKPEPGKNKIPF
jgi:hypothetical protein